MAGNGAKEVMVSMSEHAECSSATVEIKIKTLDSQTYKLRVDKYVPVPALKDQIATVTGVLSEQQRLICRGKVLKDDQLLSAYHVEDGHTLHLVVRQPVPPSEILSDYPASDPMSSGGHDLSSQARPSVLVGTINVSEQRDGALPDLGRIVSAVLSSFGTGSIGGIGEGAEVREHLVRSLSGITDSTRQQPDQAPNRAQPNSINGVSPLPNAVPLEHLAPLVIPDSLTTLSQYLSHMQREFSSSEFAVRDYGNNSQAVEGHGRAGRESNAASEDAGGQLGLPTPATLAEVMLSTRQLLVEQAGECLSQLARQLVEHTSVTDPVARLGIQSNAIRFGDLLQKLGALFFELGRTTMTLRMGQAPGDAVVNAGPAVFISTSGPNPIMVQPLPFQSGSSFGANPVGNMQSGSGISTGAFGSGFLPRDIDIRIRTGSSMPSANANHPTEAQRTPGQNNPAISRADAVNQATAVPGNSSLMEPGVRVLPIRTVIRALPATLRRAPSDSSDGSVGLFYPVLARVQRASNGSRGSQTSNSVANEQHPSSESAFGREGYVFPESDGIGSSAARDGQEFPAQMDGRLEQLLRALFPGQRVHLGDFDYRVPTSTSTAGPAEATEAAAAGQEEGAPRATDEGIFLSNMLRQVIPVISERSAVGSNEASPHTVHMGSGNALDSSTQENTNAGTSSHRRNDPPITPNSKRQRRE